MFLHIMGHVDTNMFNDSYIHVSGKPYIRARKNRKESNFLLNFKNQSRAIDTVKDGVGVWALCLHLSLSYFTITVHMLVELSGEKYSKTDN